ncbi:MAG TPA: PTS transporter subunit EIIC [Candidatus Egerieimonas intestinavium]|uniref:PTS transporter subunit EIIC n=1 Tax=Candidatus Egerieimonas intestinavium TaxID=2840777 RepID=A0A9D1EI31_9FIRM|nr:PTS transporter subunit EIIC [Candidatus Egerieimonas intestinavium]
MSYEKIAQAIIQNVGGKENIQSATHCVTRLRLIVKNPDLVSLEEIKKIDGVINCVVSSGQYQVVLGQAVTDVYKAALPLLGGEAAGTPTVSPEAPKVKKSLPGLAKQALDTLISCFVPAIPAIAGSGMIKVLVVLLSSAGLIAADSSTYTILNTIGDGIFYFLPFIVAYNAAKKMGADLFLSLALAAIVMHPNLAALGEAGSTVSFLGIGMRIMDYSAQALPMIFGVWLLKYVDKLADKVSPKIVKVFLRPMLDLLIVAPVVLIIIGPAAGVLSDGFMVLCSYMQTWGWLAVGINALLFPLMVLTGTHNATIPLIVQLFAQQGFDPIFLVCGLAANMAEAGAACAVAVKTKNKTLRSTGFSATFSALLGITEPALYGVNLPMKRPFISMLIGAFLGGCYCGLIGIVAPSFVTPSVLTAALFVPSGVNFLLGISTVPVCFIITFVIAYLVGFKDTAPNA